MITVACTHRFFAAGRFALGRAGPCTLELELETAPCIAEGLGATPVLDLWRANVTRRHDTGGEWSGRRWRRRALGRPRGLHLWLITGAADHLRPGNNHA
jgi:hypothetical protein